MWIYYPILIVIIGIILLTKWIDFLMSRRGKKGETAGDSKQLARSFIVFLAFIIIGAITIPTMGNYWPLAEAVLILFIPFYRWKDLVDANRTEELKEFYRNAVKTVIVCIFGALILYLAVRQGAYMIILEGLLVIFIPIFAMVDDIRTGGQVKMANYQSKIIGALIVVAVVLAIFLVNFFGPRQRFKRALENGNWGTADKIYEEMSEEDQEWAKDYTMEAAGNALGNLF